MKSNPVTHLVTVNAEQVFQTVLLGKFWKTIFGHNLAEWKTELGLRILRGVIFSLRNFKT